MVIFLGIEPQPNDEDGNPVESKFAITSDKTRVALSVLNNDGINWFHIKERRDGSIGTPQVSLKSGPRVAAPAEEIVEIVADGDIVGSAIAKI